MVFVTVYIACFLIWHLLMYAMLGLDVRRFFDLSTGIGLSLRAINHTANAMILAYLTVHLAGLLLPHAAAQRSHRLPVLVAIAMTAALHFVIF